MSDTKETRGTLTEEELRAEFESQHKGRNLKQHRLRGTYISAPIAALWNQHKRTAIWMQSRAMVAAASVAVSASDMGQDSIEPDCPYDTCDSKACQCADPQCHVPEGWKMVPDVGAKVRFSEGEYVIFALGDKPGTFDLQPANGRHGDRWLNVPPAAFDPAFPTSPAGADDPLERLKNPLTPYGMLVRALRIVAGTSMYDMAQKLSATPADLSAIELGRRPVTFGIVAFSSQYFSDLGIQGTKAALEAAMRASKEGA